MRVLLVAPRTDLLLVDEEIQDVLRSGLEVTPLVGRVTRSEFVREMRAGEYDVLWLATHGNSEGIQLSSGEMIPATELVAHVRERFTLVVLNTCSSLNIAQIIQEEANAGVICTLIDVPDAQAYTTGSRLASALAESATIAAAYLAAKPGRNRSYLYLPSLLPSADSLEVLAGEMRELKSMFEGLKVSYERDRDWQRKALILALVLHPVSWLVFIVTLILWRL
jgi:hypothetical protein